MSDFRLFQVSNQRILPLLWERQPDRPNLLPAYFEDDPRRLGACKIFARRPFPDREGANVTIVTNG